MTTIAGSRNDEQSAAEQINFIESMILEGRRTTEYWGWNFLLWGAAYLVAIAWSSSPASVGPKFAWPITMVAAAVLSGVIGNRKSKGQPVTTTSRAVWSIWIAVGTAIFTFTSVASFAGRFGDGHLFMAAIEILLGAGHLASGLLLRWKVQSTVGILWWVASLISILSHTVNGVSIPFLAGTFICSIGFGIYLMVLESRDKAKARAGQVAHA